MKTKKHTKSQDKFLNEISLTVKRSELDALQKEVEAIGERRAEVYRDISNSALGQANPEQVQLLKELDLKEARFASKKDNLELEQYAEGLSNRTPLERDRQDKNKGDIEKIRQRQKGRDTERER